MKAHVPTSRAPRFLTAFVASLGLGACTSDPPAGPAPPPAATLQITPAGVGVDSGSTLQLQGVARDSAGNQVTAAISWTSLDTLRATVSGSGLLRGRFPGPVRILASAGVANAGADFTVLGAPRHIAVTGGDSVLPGDSLQFIAAVFDQAVQALTIPVSWSTSEPARAQATPTGWVRGLQAGGLQVIATAGSATGRDSLRVLVPVASVLIQPDSIELAVGSRFRLRVRARSAAGDSLHRTITWSSADSGIGVVSPSGIAEGTGPGTTFVVARSEGRVDTLVLNARFLDIRALAAGDDHSCGLTADSAAFCWGNNEWGQLGNGTRTSTTTPIRSAAGRKFSQLATGVGYTCGVTSGGTYCWGLNLYGTLGTTTVGIDTTRPVLVGGGFALTHLAAAYNAVCALTAASGVVCWGLNFGTPRAVASPAFDRLTAGGGHHCGITPTDSLFCWGHNEDGRLGDGTVNSRFTPAPVLGGLLFTTVAGGGYHTCGTASGGGSYCWGNNYAWQLGDSVPGTALLPQMLPAGTPTFPIVGAGNSSSCGVDIAGAVSCWGSNTEYQLGPNANTTYRALASQVGIVASTVAVGTLHVCALTASAGAVCWGRNATGQLGTGDVMTSGTPRRVIGQP